MIFLLFQEQLFGEVPIFSGNDHCWNGKDSGRYNSKIVKDGLAHLVNNPEIQVKGPVLEPTMLQVQSEKLSVIIQQLVAAHKGQNVQWWDEVIRNFILFKFYVRHS